MEKKSFFITTILLTALIFIGAPIVNAGSPKVEICHFPPGNPDNYHTITVSVNAIDAHLDHGDWLGSCNALCDDICDDGDECTIDHFGNCEAEGCAPFPRAAVDCDDSDPCTDDSCDSTTGCINTPIVCDDSDLCTVDTCVDGDCVYAPVVCPEGEFCDENTGDCVPSPDPGCTGATCATFIPCDPAGGCIQPVCATTAEGGGVCVEGQTGCGGLLPCATSADCPGDGLCVVETCCGVPVCAQPEIWCVNIPETTSEALQAADVGPTIGCE